jgi:hypothetical protein
MRTNEEVREYQIKNLNEMGTKSLLNAVKVMREACDEAERVIKQAEGQIDARIAAMVIHRLAWGHVNATGDIECALDRVHDISEAEKWVPDE